MKVLIFALALFAVFGCAYCKPLRIPGLPSPTFPQPFRRFPQQNVEQQDLAKANGVKDFLKITGCAMQNIFGSNNGDGITRNGQAFSGVLRRVMQGIIDCMPKTGDDNEMVMEGEQIVEAEGAEFEDIVKGAFGTILRGLADKVAGGENLNQEALNEIMKGLTQELEEEQVAEVEEDEEMANEQFKDILRGVGADLFRRVADRLTGGEEELAEEQFAFLPFLVKAVGGHVISKGLSKIG